MRLALCQVNPTIGDFDGNLRRCLDFARRAARQRPDLIIFPEMVMPGYPPRDLLYNQAFVEASLAASQDFANHCNGLPPVLFGSLAWKAGLEGAPGGGLPRLLNVAYLAQHGRLQVVAEKRLLPVYDVFYEPRWFAPGQFIPPFALNGQKIGVLICEDLWDEEYPIHPAAELSAAGADLLVCLSASPFRAGVWEKRLHHARRASNSHSLPLVFVNQVGANDELIFDGRSFMLMDNALRHCDAAFEESVSLLEWSKADAGEKMQQPQPEGPAELASAIALGIRDFARKNGLKQAFLGLSGGVDSALVAVLACQALGPENVTCLALPSRYSNPLSTETARQLCQNLGCHFDVVPLEPLHTAAEQTLGGLPAGQGAPTTTLENVQARLRMVVLMAYVNQQGGFLLNTSNKTELSFGYSTLYGDMAGALCPIADLTKPEVYALAEYLNAEWRMINAEYGKSNSAFIIPEFIISRAPSAELRPDQVDPFDYPAVSPKMENLVQNHGYHPAIWASEHKRWQMGIILKVSEKAFGTGRMVPVTKT